LSANGNHQDCRDRSILISASPANQIVTLASSLESDLGNCGWIVD
jgi:hypothetical protein